MPDTTFTVNGYASSAPSTGADYAKTTQGTGGTRGNTLLPLHFTLCALFYNNYLV
jgi:hypothetical protein